MANVAILGSGGFAKEVAELARLNGHQVVSCYSVAAGAFETLHRGYLAEMQRDRNQFEAVVLGIGATDRRSLSIRRGLVDWLLENRFACPAVVSPSAVCAEGVVLGPGVVVAHGAILGVDSRIDAFSVCNSGSMIGHDARVGSNVVVAPGAFLGGNVSVGQNSLIGPLSKVLQGITLGEDTLVGVGCLALRDLSAGQTIWPRFDQAR
ncbi:acetyltransferase [Brevundimonas kwangchunensis]|uniref:Acetyltransferase n=1 Tax=Brevundimonas kwangchunensis TaxID=322163 RepID=A0ABN1GGJ0_9CAUL